MPLKCAYIMPKQWRPFFALETGIWTPRVPQGWFLFVRPQYSEQFAWLVECEHLACRPPGLGTGTERGDLWTLVGTQLRSEADRKPETFSITTWYIRTVGDRKPVHFSGLLQIEEMCGVENMYM